MLEARQRVLTPDHPDTLRSRSNLARAYIDAGPNNEAISLHEQVLEARTRVLGADHPDTLTSDHNLANAYRIGGRTDEAIALFQKTVDATERVLGSDHPYTLSSRKNLLTTYQESGRTDETITLREQVLEIPEPALSADHPDALVSRSNLPTAFEGIHLHGDVLALLGKNGMTVFHKVSAAIRAAATKYEWPLESIEAGKSYDPELENFAYGLVMLKLETSQEQTEVILDQLYTELQTLSDGLPKRERAALAN